MRFEQELKSVVETNDDGVLKFDIILLGMGSDGHTASIFPHEIELLDSPKFCAVATHPESGQKRISLTGQVINQGRNVFFLVTGQSKASVLAEIINRTGAFESYPTTRIVFFGENGELGERIFYLDEAAASAL